MALFSMCDVVLTHVIAAEVQGDEGDSSAPAGAHIEDDATTELRDIDFDDGAYRSSSILLEQNSINVQRIARTFTDTPAVMRRMPLLWPNEGLRTLTPKPLSSERQMRRCNWRRARLTCEQSLTRRMNHLELLWLIVSLFIVFAELQAADSKAQWIPMSSTSRIPHL